jgi:hypothetical protein
MMKNENKEVRRWFTGNKQGHGIYWHGNTMQRIYKLHLYTTNVIIFINNF